MNSCAEIERHLDDLAVRPPDQLPEWAQRHMAECDACRRRLRVTRLARGLVTAGTETVAPPEGFADRVVSAAAASRVRRDPTPDIWRPARGLVPTFAAAVAALMILYQTSDGSGPIGFLPTEGLSAGEELLLAMSVSVPDMDAVLAVVMEGGWK